MSWFDAGALANIAKSALKEAQKTIDKALDIKEETEQNMQADSVWGSFTGSFFVDQNDSLDFSTSKLVVQEEENEDACITHSDSVEILGDSSIEIISTDESTTQQLTDEFVSPLDSPIVVDGKLSSPESVEIIPEDQEETSIADDTMSCTSISETTVLDLTQKMLYNESVEAITRAPGRSMHLALIDEKTNIIDIPLLDSSDGSISDKTLVDVQIVEGSSSDTASTTTDVSSNSTYLKKMLADAMAEKSSQSDLVKIGSDHTSCDELETTTSSDIEIISSPNGDSSSTQSRQSPIKKPELSSDDSCDINKLLRRIAEMTDILESRESKLIETNRRNAELQEQNSDLKNQLNCLLHQQQDIDLSQVTEEYTQRLSALEKKFQQALREKDVLKKQLEQAKLDVAARLSKNELESAVADKEEVIRELRQEGEKLSKQQLQHGNIIKKLRAKEKEHETTIKTLREANENLTTETDRLKKSLSAKEEVERTQIEAVHNLTQKHKKLEAELLKTKSQLEDLTQKHSTTKKSLEAAKQELQEQTKSCSELQLKQTLLQNLEDEKKMTQSQNYEVIEQLDLLRKRLAQTEQESALHTQKLKLENTDLLRRLEEAETRNEELSQTVLDVSKPLVRQLETLQATHNMKMANYEKLEGDLLLKIGDLKSKNQQLLSSERVVKEECVCLRSKLAELEGQLGTVKHQAELNQMQLEQARTEQVILEQDLKSKIKQQADLIFDKDKEIQQLKQQLAIDYEKQQQDSPTMVDRSSPSSPTLSLGKVSVSESLSGSFWSQDEPFEATHAPRYTNMFEMQMLQSTLKQREGELQQAQWELNRREQERSLLNLEISKLINRIEELEVVDKNYNQIKLQLTELQKQYDTLCQLFGEKVEETEELKLDLEDVKDMYKSQIDELLRQQL